MGMHLRSDFETGLARFSGRNATQRPGVSRKVHAGKSQRAKGLAWPVLLFLVALVVPWILTVGPLSLPSPRLILLAMVLPCLAQWMTGRAGRIRAADIAILLFCLWCALSLVMVHGAAFAVQPAGMLFVETMGAYLLSRCYIRSADDFLNMARVLFRIVAFLFPFALIEALTGRNVLLQLFSVILPSYPDSGADLRGGLYRVQVVFEHPILFGICAGSALPLTHLVLGRGKPLFQRSWRTGLVVATAVLSMSSAPLAVLVLQGLLMMWNWLLRSVAYRWKILWGVFLASYLFVEFGSNQTPVQFYISRLTFNPHTGWHRLVIWEYGSASVVNNPLFGVGFGDWARASWMSSSVDMFWLVYAMRHGLPAGLLILSAFLMLFLAVSFRKDLDEHLNACRMAYLIIMTSFFIVGWTVHLWGMAYIWFVFLLGSGAWLLDVRVDKGAASPLELNPTVRDGVRERAHRPEG
jgi:hypothetical protein